MPSLREIRRKIKSVKSTVGRACAPEGASARRRGPELLRGLSRCPEGAATLENGKRHAQGNRCRRTRSACQARASAQQITKAMKMVAAAPAAN